MTDHLTEFRNRHNREEHHFGTLEATLVELSDDIGAQLAAGATLEAAITNIHDRLVAMELGAYLDRFTVDAYLGPGLTADAIALKTIVGQGLTADAIALKAIGQGLTADAIALKTIVSQLLADARIIGADEQFVTADAIALKTIVSQLLADAWIGDDSKFMTAAAIILAVASGSFTADAQTKKTYSFTDSSATYDHSYAINSSATSWTHTAPANAKAIVVTCLKENPSWVTYGNKPLVLRGSTTSTGPNTYIWTLEDISGRDDDVVRMSVSNTYRSSTIISTLGDPVFVAFGSYDPPGTSWSAGDHTITLDDGIAQHSSRVMLTNTGGGKDGPNDPVLSAYAGDGSGEILSTGHPSNNPVVGYSGGVEIQVDGPDTTSLTGGWTLSDWSGFVQSSAVLIRIPHGVLANAIVKGQGSASIAADAVLLRGFLANAVIVSDATEEATLGDMTLGDNTLGG